MTKRLALLLFLSAGVALGADRYLAETQLIRALNGSATALGVAASVDGGAFSTCFNTASPFDAGFGDLMIAVCSENGYMRTGTCSSTASISSRPVLIGSDTVTLLKTTEMALNFLQQDGGNAMRCYVGHLQ